MVDNTTLEGGDAVPQTPEKILEQSIETAQTGADLQEKAEADAGIDLETMSEQDISKLPQEQILDLIEGKGIKPAAQTDVTVETTADPAALESTGVPQTNANTVPIPRLNQEIEKRRLAEEALAKANEEKAFLMGKLEAAKQQPAASAAAPAPQDHLQTLNGYLQQIDAELNAELAKLDEKADNGELGFKELRQEERKLRQRAAQVSAPIVAKRQSIIQQLNAPKPDEVEAEILHNPVVLAETQRLRGENPWLDKLPDNVLDGLSKLAMQSLEEEGKSINADVKSTLLLRFKIAELGKQFGLDTVYSAPAQQAPVTNLSQVTPNAEQRREKLALAKNHPPSVAQAGVVSGDNTDYSKMTESDLSALPTSTLARLAGDI